MNDQSLYKQELKIGLTINTTTLYNFLLQSHHKEPYLLSARAGVDMLLISILQKIVHGILGHLLTGDQILAGCEFNVHGRSF